MWDTGWDAGSWYVGIVNELQLLLTSGLLLLLADYLEIIDRLKRVLKQAGKKVRPVRLTLSIRQIGGLL